jgi:oligopeptide transport system ATP-binding protein
MSDGLWCADGFHNENLSVNISTVTSAFVKASGDSDPVNDLILNVDGVKKYFPVKSRFLKRRVGWIKAVDGISFAVSKGDLMGLVGESGCGKTTLAKTIMGMYRPDQGHVTFKDRVIAQLSVEEIRKLRREIQYVYQDSAASLDPWWTIGRLLREPLLIHTSLTREEMEEKILSLLESVGMSREHLNCYPHEFSGGQLRRLGLARILTLNPELIIFDEPTAGLDVSVQAKILELLLQLKTAFHLTYIIISHNLGLVRMICRQTAVMYLGRIVERGPTEEVFENAKHPYTRILLDSIPNPGEKPKEGRLFLLGEPPSPDCIPSGCRFQNRCPFKVSRCEDEDPPATEVSPGHSVACHL